MTKEERHLLIKKIEEERKSKLICLFLGDRISSEPNLDLTKQIGDDLVRYLYDILKNENSVDNIDIFLYSRGGSTEVPLKIINLLRVFCKKLSIIIPYRAHSAATMIAIGCDEILMDEMSELGPIDPSVTTIYNPANPANALQKYPIETESILSYRDAMKRDFNLWLRPAKIASLLAQNINPIIIGAAYRARSLSRSVINNFLNYHIKGVLGFIKRRRTANKLLRSDSHAYAININEAESLGLNVVRMSGDLKENVWKLFECYEEDLKLKDIFNPMVAMGGSQNKIENITKAILENRAKTYRFETKINLTLTKNQQNQNNVNWVIEESWVLS